MLRSSPGASGALKSLVVTNVLLSRHNAAAVWQECALERDISLDRANLRIVVLQRVAVRHWRSTRETVTDTCWNPSRLSRLCAPVRGFGR